MTFASSISLPVAASTVGIVLIVVTVLLVLFFIGGLLGARSRSNRQAGTFYEHIREADEALEQARAADKGWHRETMEAAAREAVGESRPGWTYGDLHLVLVDDRPGVEEDRAHFVAVGDDGEVHVVLARQGERWVAERVE